MNEPRTPSEFVARRAGAWLAARGVRAGDVVALCAPDSAEVAVMKQAISSIGAIEVTLSPLSSRRDLFAQLCGSGARWLVTTGDLFVQKLEVAARPTAVMQTFLIGSALGDAPAPGGPRSDVPPLISCAALIATLHPPTGQPRLPRSVASTVGATGPQLGSREARGAAPPATPQR